MVRVILALVAVMFGLSGCGERPAPAGAAEPAMAPERMDTQLVHGIALASYHTSPPQHPSMAWPELARTIEQARIQLEQMQALAKPAALADPLAERVSSAQLTAIAEARTRASVYRAEAARLLARGDADGAGHELALALGVAREMAAWGVPAAAEASAEVIGTVLDALKQPDAAAMTIAMSTQARAEMANTLQQLDRIDPAGRMRAMVESTSARVAELEERAQGADGPTAVREVASRYVPGAQRGDAKQIERSMAEARAFARALADGWDKPSRSAITTRLRDRQAEDAAGVLAVLLADAGDACDADARLRQRIAEAIEALR